MNSRFFYFKFDYMGVLSLLVSKATASAVRRFQSHFVFPSCSWTPIVWAVLMLTASLRS